MPYKIWVPGEEMLAADVNDYLQEQVVARFATAAARDAAILAPNVGQPVYLTTPGQLLVYYGATLGWRPPWNQPWGVLDLVTRATAIVLSAAGVIVLTSAAVTIPANRRIRLTATAFLYNTTASINNSLAIEIRRGTTVGSPRVGAGGAGLLNTGGLPGDGSNAVISAIEPALAAGTYQWVLTGVSTSSASILADATLPCQLVIEDAGPNGSPP